MRSSTRARRRRCRPGAGRRPAAGGSAARTALRRRVVPGLVERLLEPGLEVVERLLGLLEGDVAPLDQRLGVELADRAPGFDPLVHERLRVARVVALVVTEAPVADHVDHDVLVEPLPVVEGEAGDADAGLGIVAVHVEDRRLHHLGDVGAVLRAARRLGRGGEAELVVDDQVDGAADAVALDHPELQRLGHDALAGEGGVAVDRAAAAPRSDPGWLMRSCLARAMPTTIGSTVSRWLGLADSSTSISLPGRG